MTCHAQYATVCERCGLLIHPYVIRKGHAIHQRCAPGADE